MSEMMKMEKKTENVVVSVFSQDFAKRQHLGGVCMAGFAAALVEKLGIKMHDIQHAVIMPDSRAILVYIPTGLNTSFEQFSFQWQMDEEGTQEEWIAYITSMALSKSSLIQAKKEGQFNTSVAEKSPIFETSSAIN